MVCLTAELTDEKITTENIEHLIKLIKEYLIKKQIIEF